MGFRSGHGILLAHLPGHHPSEPPRWSAPVFLKASARERPRAAAQLPLPSLLLLGVLLLACWLCC